MSIIAFAASNAARRIDNMAEIKNFILRNKNGSEDGVSRGASRARLLLRQQTGSGEAKINPSRSD